MHDATYAAAGEGSGGEDSEREGRAYSNRSDPTHPKRPGLYVCDVPKGRRAEYWMLAPVSYTFIRPFSISQYWHRDTDQIPHKNYTFTFAVGRSLGAKTYDIHLSGFKAPNQPYPTTTPPPDPHLPTSRPPPSITITLLPSPK